MYHDNPIINDIMLTVINDGSGSQCGYSYLERLAAANRFGAGLGKFRTMAQNYNRLRVLSGSEPATRQEWIEAGDRLFAYYQEHLKEIAGTNV